MNGGIIVIVFANLISDFDDLHTRATDRHAVVAVREHTQLIAGGESTNPYIRVSGAIVSICALNCMP